MWLNSAHLTCSPFGDGPLGTVLSPVTRPHSRPLHAPSCDVIRKPEEYLKTWRHDFVEWDYKVTADFISFIFRFLEELQYLPNCFVQALCQRA